MLLKAPYPGQIASSALIRAFYPVMVTPFVLQYYLTGGRHVFSLREQRERRNGFWGWPAQEVKAVARAGRPIWMHAAAAGETAAAHAIIQHVRDRFPETPLVLSVSELEGKDMARKLGVKADAVFYFPFDLPGIAARAVRPAVDFGTEAGLLSEGLHVPCVICGPGDIEQAHVADEFVVTAQLDACMSFLFKLAEKLSS